MGTKIKSSLLLKRIYRYRYIYMILLPGIVFFSVFAYGPLYGIQLAFKSYSVRAGIWGSEWIGLKNFEMLIKNPEFFRALTNTFILAFMKLVITFPVPIILAMVINELTSRRFKGLLQTVVTLPHFLSWIVLSGILLNFFGNDGVVNNFISYLGGQRVMFLGNPQGFRWLLVLTEVWKESGWSCIIYIAAISGIDTAQYESATLDGANRLQKMWYLTWPGIRGTAVVILILAVGNVMNSNFDQVFNLYNPAVFSTADVLDTYIYRISFQQQGNFGFSTAVGLFKGVVNCVLLLTANFVTKKLNDTGIM